MANESVSNIRQGYRQGSTGAHTDGGAEHTHGRSERTKAREGQLMGKSPKARQDGGFENARGKPNQRSEATGPSHGFDPTICRYMDAHTDGGKEHTKGRSTTSSMKK